MQLAIFLRNARGKTPCLISDRNAKLTLGNSTMASAPTTTSADNLSPVPKPSEFTDLWRHRGLLAELIRRDLRERYAGSAMGVLWNVIHPLIMIAIYIFVFTLLFPSGRTGGESRFAVYLCAGLVPWLLFNETISRCSSCFTNYGGILTKTAFPKSILTLTIGATALATFLVTFTVYMIYLGSLVVLAPPGPNLGAGQVFAALGVVLLMQVFALGLGIGLATLNVFFRDVGQIVAVGLQVMFWGSPILWRSEFIAEKAPEVLPWLKLNPLYFFLEYFHKVFAASPAPYGLTHFLIIPAWTAAAVIFGTIVYRKLRDEIVDEL